MRSDTANLVFKPTVQEWLDSEVVAPSRAASEGAGEGQSGTDVRVRGEIASRPIVADDLSLSGHVGALYMKSGGKARGRTKGTGDFHAGLRALWAFEKDPRTYPREVVEHLRKDGGLWNGNPRNLLPVSFDRYAPDVKSEFVSKAGGGSWGDDLEALMGEVKRRYVKVEREIGLLAGRY